METNTLYDLFITTVIILASIVIAQFVHQLLQKKIVKLFSRQKKDARQSPTSIPGYFRLFILIRGCLIAFDTYHLPPAVIEYAGIIRMAFILCGNLCLYLGLINFLRFGLHTWAAGLQGTTGTGKSQDAAGSGQSIDIRVRKAGTLINILILILGVIVFLPELHLDLPKREILFTAVFLVLANMLFFGYTVAFLEKKNPAAAAEKKRRSSSDQEFFDSMTAIDPDFPIVDEIAGLFLDIMRHHLRAGKNAQCRYKLVKHDIATAKYLFDLEVLLHSNWKKRRATVGRLGAETGSRSKCFYVIYDEYLVIKVPPEPITEPVEYLASLKKEATLARQIDMEACIVPSVSVILKYVDPSITAQQNSIDSPEELAIISLRRQPERYRFLQIGETFAYFMDMSKYYFLQKVIKTLHMPDESGNRPPLIRIKAQLEGLCTNLMDLLAHIGNKGVALRDLKPDNMLVAGDNNNYPGFLSRPDEYVTGLIDIETGVVFGNPPLKRIVQPQLGGTPRYATASHFFTNDLIHLLYGDVADILHLQDWYGMIAVLFKTITGQYLFRESAKTIPFIVKKLNTTTNAEEVYRFAINASRHFWNNATDEFTRKTEEERQTLDELQISISSPVIAMFKKRLSEEQEKLTDAIRQLVTGQAISTADAHKLLTASCEEVENYEQKWTKLADTREELTKSKTKVIKFLQKLSRMKHEFEQHEAVEEMLSHPTPKMSAGLLLKTMFSVVRRKMLQPEWDKIPLQDIQATMQTPEVNLSETVLEETGTEYQTVQNEPTRKI